ncbi:hypothetical protein LLEC1_03455 [Akanthomyces lecanii]|uniref:N-acetyltransferase ESCO zinc-finger domain-containing protein n=1 Tax=Cordyceps confragosa TaxID=2714763 RepID=A0A179ISS0_CORDF|nr:hypothetical protein LLEC1_03455 [Akanthomyces lecanii]
MTQSIVDCLASVDDQALPSGEPSDPALTTPAIGNPILHSQILKLSRCQNTFRLEELLRGSQVYVAPPAPKPAKSPEYIALMAKLRRDEDARAYERMINPPIPLETFKDRFPDSARSFAAVNRPANDADLGDDEITYNEVHRQVTLLINFMVSIAGVAATLWILGRWWSVPARLFLTMGGSILVAIAEVAVYGGYVWRMGEAKRKEDNRPERREVVQTWVVGEDGDENGKEDKAVLLPEKADVTDSCRSGTRFPAVGVASFASRRARLQPVGAGLSRGEACPLASLLSNNILTLILMNLLLGLVLNRARTSLPASQRHSAAVNLNATSPLSLPSKRHPQTMVNSSPEYAITKPGVRPLSRKRDKPMRTYGRQSTATPEPRSEPPAKRARITYAIHDDKNVKPLGITFAEDDAPTVAVIFKAAPQPAAEQDQENEPLSKPEPNVPAKRSILNYFKPVTTHLTPIKHTQTNMLSAVEPNEEKRATEQKNATDEQGATTGKKEPAEKEVQPSTHPKRRLLRIRSNQSINSKEPDENSGCNAEYEGDESSDAIKHESRPRRKRRLGGGASARCDSRRTRRKAASAEVQTTLNISNQAPFSECKTCDTVWNPLYPDDVKYHTKRHAAQLRTKKQKDKEF